MSKFLPVILTTILMGCALNPNNKSLIVLQNPKTQEVKECKGDPWASWDAYAATEACAKAYEKAGFVRLGDY